MVGRHSGIEPTPLAPNQVVVDVQEMPGTRGPRHDLDNLGCAGVLANTRPLHAPLPAPTVSVPCQGTALITAVKALGTQVAPPVPLVSSCLRR